MAITIGTDTTIGGRDNGGGLRRAGTAIAGAAIGLALLAGIATGQVRPAAQEAAPRVAAPLAVGIPQFAPDQFTFREDHRAASSGAFAPDQFTFREDRRTSAPRNGTCIFSNNAGVPGEGCIANNTARPDGQFVPDQFTFREDHRAER